MKYFKKSKKNTYIIKKINLNMFESDFRKYF